MNTRALRRGLERAKEPANGQAELFQWTPHLSPSYKCLNMSVTARAARESPTRAAARAAKLKSTLALYNSTIGNYVANHGVASAMRELGVTRSAARYWCKKVTEVGYHDGALGGARTGFTIEKTWTNVISRLKVCERLQSGNCCPFLFNTKLTITHRLSTKKSVCQARREGARLTSRKIAQNLQYYPPDLPQY